jgi:methionyl-tRNA formyltransferase
MRVLYLGTPDFAAIPLEALVQDPRFEVVGVVTQPDRPTARHRTPQPPPVKQAALRLGVPVLQPETLRDPGAVRYIAELRPDVGVIAAYGEILRRDVLAIPPHGYLNIHPSLLPRYRGPAPVAGALLTGDAETGVTVIQVSAKMDSGPILSQQRVPLPPDARTGPLTDALFRLGTALLLGVLPPYVAGKLMPKQQNDKAATYTRLLTRADGEIDWRASACQIERMTRAFDPWPSAYTFWHGQLLKIFAARVIEWWQGDEPPGTLIAHGDSVWVATGAGALELLSVQPAGKRPRPADIWLHGLRNISGQQLGQ